MIGNLSSVGYEPRNAMVRKQHLLFVLVLLAVWTLPSHTASALTTTYKNGTPTAYVWYNSLTFGAVDGGRATYAELVSSTIQTRKSTCCPGGTVTIASSTNGGTHYLGHPVATNAFSRCQASASGGTLLCQAYRPYE